MTAGKTAQNNGMFFLAAIAAAILCGGASLLSGCIADTAEDTDLPWATNKKWEGIVPVSPSVTDRYD